MKDTWSMGRGGLGIWVWLLVKFSSFSASSALSFSDSMVSVLTGAGTDLRQRLFCPKLSPQCGSTPVRVVRVKQKANSSLHNLPLSRTSWVCVVSAPILHVTSQGSTTESGVESTSGHWDWFGGQQCPTPQFVDSSIPGSKLSGCQGLPVILPDLCTGLGPLGHLGHCPSVSLC